MNIKSSLVRDLKLVLLLNFKNKNMKNLKEVNEIVKALIFYKGEIERSRAVK
jgi:hypothetical protein